MRQVQPQMLPEGGSGDELKVGVVGAGKRKEGSKSYPTQCSRQNLEIGGCRGVESKALVSNPASILASVTMAQLIAMVPTYTLHVYNCLVNVTEHRSALHAIILMGGAAASETLIGGIFA